MHTRALAGTGYHTILSGIQNYNCEKYNSSVPQHANIEQYIINQVSMSVLPPEPLSRLLEGREADRVAAEAERGVDVLHEAVAEEPDVAAETEVLASESTHALAARACGTEVEAGRAA